jgi:formylglycine-generating enzyme required for sulfatase activity
MLAVRCLLLVAVPVAVLTATLALLPSAAEPPPANPPPAPMDCTGEKGLSAAAVKAAQQAWAKYLGRQLEEEDEIAPGVKIKFVLVPPGKFLMGSPKDEKDRTDNETQHEVTLTKPFYLGQCEVTQAQYEAVTKKTPSHFKGANLPVERVSWEEADEFAKELTKKAGGKILYRLPTEAEWEYSCRGGRPFSNPFGIGDGTSLSSKQANFDGNYPYGAAKGKYLEETCAVGSYPANALGLNDVHGNVWEWCADWYGNYPVGKVTDPTGPPEGLDRVTRGGSFTSYANWCRAAFRDRDGPENRSWHLGFRLARVPSGLGK